MNGARAARALLLSPEEHVYRCAFCTEWTYVVREPQPPECPRCGTPLVVVIPWSGRIGG